VIIYLDTSISCK